MMPRRGAAGPRRPGNRRRARHAWAVVLLVVPLLVALAGPLVADGGDERGRAYGPAGGGHPLGTDFVGRDVLGQVMLGGRSVVLVAVLAVGLAYLVGLPLGMCAASTRRRRLDEALMRPLDLVLAVPSLLTLVMVAGLARPGPVVLSGVVALILLPEVARVVRAAALAPAAGPAMEAMRLYRETWWRRTVGYLGRTMLPTLLADVGTRVVGALYLVASAAFLGVGVAPDAADWAVMVDRNRPGMFLQPWAVVVPALLIIALSVGVNVLFDDVLADRHDSKEQT